MLCRINLFITPSVAMMMIITTAILSMMNFLIITVLEIDDASLQISEDEFKNHTAVRYIIKTILLLRLNSLYHHSMVNIILMLI
jgi:hypothetical protein